jgi:hypothetical protein
MRTGPVQVPANARAAAIFMSTRAHPRPLIRLSRAASYIGYTSKPCLAYSGAGKGMSAGSTE